MAAPRRIQPVVQNGGENLDITHTLESFQTHSQERQQLQRDNIFGPRYTDILDSQYKKVKSEKTEVTIEKMCFSCSGNEIWCITETGGIQVRDRKDCKVVKRFIQTLGSYKGAKGIAQTETGEFIVVGKNGIYLLDSQGVFMETVTEGVGYVDVCIHCSRFYALQEIPIENFTHTNCVVHCAQISETPGKIISFSNKTDIQIDTNSSKNFGRHNWDKICVSNGFIYISSVWNNCVYLYDMDGGYRYSTGTYGAGPESGMLYAPQLCGVDQFGNVLVADWNNNRLQLWTTVGYSWCNVDTLQPPDLVRPTQAVMNQTGNDLWVSTNKELIRFSKTDTLLTLNSKKNSDVSSTCVIL